MFNLHSIYISRILWSKYQKSLNSGLLSVFYCGLDMHSFNTKNMLNLPKYYIATGGNVFVPGCPSLYSYAVQSHGDHAPGMRVLDCMKQRSPSNSITTTTRTLSNLLCL